MSAADGPPSGKDPSGSWEMRREGPGSPPPSYAVLRHFLAALAYRTQKALRGASPEWADFEPGNRARTPRQLVHHMTSVLGYALWRFRGGERRREKMGDMETEVARFHQALEELAAHLDAGAPLPNTTPERLLQGPLADAMTHAGQLAMLRRLAGEPVPPEDFTQADVDPHRLGPDQPDPVAPAAQWPEAPGS